jgi:hypothetical protein
MALHILVRVTTVFGFDDGLMTCSPFFSSFSHRVLVVLDRLMSASLGRPCAIQEEEYVLMVHAISRKLTN